MADTQHWLQGRTCDDASAQSVRLQDDAAAGSWVAVIADPVVVAVDQVTVGLGFPGIGHLSDGDQLNRLPLRRGKRARGRRCVLES